MTVGGMRHYSTYRANRYRKARSTRDQAASGGTRRGASSRSRERGTRSVEEGAELRGRPPAHDVTKEHGALGRFVRGGCQTD